ncbi:MAG: hypothetical protein J5585_09740 [Clostridia bacterium]|nr:hypothetical protein [Clostridia bacterium]
MKKAVSIALLVFLLLPFASCTAGPEETGADVTETVTQTETASGWTGPADTEDKGLSEGGKRYYFSAEGDDKNDGTTPQSAKKSLSVMDGVTLCPGDRVLLRRGDTWHERLVLRGRGDADGWIYIGAYGEGDEMPRISLDNGRDDIAVLCEDAENGLGYMWFDGISVGDTHLGIYLRANGVHDDGHIRITGCEFFNVNCPELMAEAMTSVGWLGEKKGGLSGNGGVYEYIWPTAINVGGRPALPLASVSVDGVCAPSTVLSCVEISDCRFDGCVIAVGANCYSYHYGTGANQFMEYTANWSMKNVVCRGTMTALNFDSCDFGYEGEGSEWGVFENIDYDDGMSSQSMAFGTTAALLSSCRDLYIKNSRFCGCRNGGSPDGCGFDLERDDHNITLDGCIIADNDGQGVLIMDTVMLDQVSGENVHTPSTDCTIKNCVFLGNMKNVYNENYCFDILVFNRENERITVSGCDFYCTEKTHGAAQVRINRRGSKQSPVGQIVRGVTVEDCTVRVYENREKLPSLEEITGDRG